MGGHRSVGGHRHSNQPIRELPHSRDLGCGRGCGSFIYFIAEFFRNHPYQRGYSTPVYTDFYLCPPLTHVAVLLQRWALSLRATVSRPIKREPDTIAERHLDDPACTNRHWRRRGDWIRTNPAWCTIMWEVTKGDPLPWRRRHLSPTCHLTFWSSPIYPRPQVKRGGAYAWCNGISPTTSLLCEPGATATDPNLPQGQQDITSSLVVCPRADCIVGNGCSPQVCAWITALVP